MCAKNNWLETLFKEWVTKFKKQHYMITYEDDPNYRGPTPPDFCLMGAPNVLVECKYFSHGSFYYHDRVSKNQYFQLNKEYLPTIESYILLGIGNIGHHYLYMIPWSVYKTWYKQTSMQHKFTEAEMMQYFYEYKFNEQMHGYFHGRLFQ